MAGFKLGCRPGWAGGDDLGGLLRRPPGWPVRIECGQPYRWCVGDTELERLRVLEFRSYEPEIEILGPQRSSVDSPTGTGLQRGQGFGCDSEG